MIDRGRTGRAVRTANAHIPICYAERDAFPNQATLGASFVLETRFTGVRLILANYGSDEMRLASMSAAASSSTESLTHAVGGQWVSVTVNGETPVVPPGRPERPALVVTDLLPIESIDRTDGGTGFALYTRAAGPKDGPTSFNRAGLVHTTDEFNAGTPGRPVTYFYCGNDHAALDRIQSLANSSLASANYPAFVVAGVIFYSEQPCKTLWGVGDSLTMGLSAGANYSGFARSAAAELSRPGRGVSYVDASFPGQTVRQFLARARDLLDAGVPAHFVTLPIDSANDYVAADGFRSRVRQEAETLSFLDQVIDRGIAPIMVTSLPLMHGGIDVCSNQRVISSNKLRAMQRPGLPVLDAQRVLFGRIPSVDQPINTLPGFVGPDGSHISEAGQAMVGAELVSLLDPLLADVH